MQEENMQNQSNASVVDQIIDSSRQQSMDIEMEILRLLNGTQTMGALIALVGVSSRVIASISDEGIRDTSTRAFHISLDAGVKFILENPANQIFRSSEGG